MKTMRWMQMVVLAVALAGCGSGPTRPPVVEPLENWSYPAGGSQVAATMVAEHDSVKVGDAFDLKFVCYNVNGMYGATVRLEYDVSKVRADRVIAGPFAGGAASVSVGRADEAEGLVRFASTYTDSTKASSGSGVLFKIKCTALAAGRPRFRVRGSDVTLVVRSGADIPDMQRIRPEDRTVVIVP